MVNSKIGKVIDLPTPTKTGKMSIEETIVKRESVRAFTQRSLTKEELSQLCFALQGITRKWGGRTTPSAGALYPLEVYVVLPDGVYKYIPHKHRLELKVEGDVRVSLSRAALGQDCIASAPSVFVIAAVFERVTRKYGKRGERYVMIEVGHAAQNFHLQAVALNLASVPVGAFYDDEVHRVLKLEREEIPLYLLPVGEKK
ncbi:MAG: SagB/ThcOx family dehydrogenase [Syntrophales bacterium]|nr:SagB/ThcOx family dehydrogenase [Syntrophales bacterium]